MEIGIDELLIKWYIESNKIHQIISFFLFNVTFIDFSCATQFYGVIHSDSESSLQYFSLSLFRMDCVNFNSKDMIDNNHIHKDRKFNVNRKRCYIHSTECMLLSNAMQFSTELLDPRENSLLFFFYFFFAKITSVAVIG